MAKYTNLVNLVVDGEVKRPGTEVDIADKKQADALIEKGFIEKPKTKAQQKAEAKAEAQEGSDEAK
jgi:hypothetical protein